MSVKTGDVVFSHKCSGLYPRLVKWFTGGPSHCFFIAGNFHGYECALESDLKCQLVPFEKEYGEKKEDNYEVYRPIAADVHDLEASGRAMFHEFAGELYGFLQLLFWPIKTFFALIGWRSYSKNLFPKGLICSELLLFYIRSLGGEYAKAVEGLNPDTTAPSDLLDICRMRPDLFQHVESRDLGSGAWRPRS